MANNTVPTILPSSFTGLRVEANQVNIVDKNVALLVLNFPLTAVVDFPDPDYPHTSSDPMILWQGGPTRYGKWRQYAFMEEHTWALTYNFPYIFNPFNNGALGQPVTQIGPSDTNDPLSCSLEVSFDLVEANNSSLIIRFAPPTTNVGDPPHFSGSSYIFGGPGGTGPSGTNLPVQLELNTTIATDGQVLFVVNGAQGALAFHGLTHSFALTNGITDKIIFDLLTGAITAANIPSTYNSSGTLQTNAHIVADTVILSGGTATVTLTGLSVFATAYQCVAQSDTAANPVQVVQNSLSSITFNGTGSDVIRYIAIGN